ncbi:MAG: glycosyl hydrolase, partial [Xanthomonadales bacterium]|nr:glycosyl hydrolase [Xanthomonadales bacterium]
VLRFVSTIGRKAYVSTSSEGWKGYALDVFDEAALRRYWDAVVEPLIDDAGQLAGTTLRYLHTDSWEIRPTNWSTGLLGKFRHYRGYDPVPWLPVLAGRIINTREESNRFLDDFRKTLGDLAVDQHFRPFREWAHAHGLEIHPESGGPHGVPIDAQRTLGQNDVPMSEFWARSWRHRIEDQERFFVKQPASAAHTYGHRLVAAEGFTTIGPHWQETLWDNLKPAFDYASTEGLNRLFWHAFVNSPAEEGLPGIQYFAGTHFNPNSTWWDKSGPFIDYLNRSQFMLQRGLFVADVLYFYGDHVPNFTQLGSSDPASVGQGYDYDVITEEALLTRASVREGRIFLPDGMNYRLLVLPPRDLISVGVLQKVRDLAAAGATVIMTRPNRPAGLTDRAARQQMVFALAEELFGQSPAGAALDRRFQSGRVVSGQTAREVLLSKGILPDFEYFAAGKLTEVNYIHRRDGDNDIYFIASREGAPLSLQATFRTTGKAPELWDAISGETRFASAYSQSNDRTTLPLEFPPYGSLFVVFREPAVNHPPTSASNAPGFEVIEEISGAWDVAFDPAWGGPETARFPTLVSWTERPELGIRYYSGTATYRNTIDVPSGLEGKSTWLDLGRVRELAEVKLNGKSCGITWAPPFRVDISEALRPGRNQLEIEVVNFWPNRIIGDDALPMDQRLTQTNIRQLSSETALMPSGLFGPVVLLERKEPD